MLERLLGGGGELVTIVAGEGEPRSRPARRRTSSATRTSTSRSTTVARSATRSWSAWSEGRWSRSPRTPRWRPSSAAATPSASWSRRASASARWATCCTTCPGATSCPPSSRRSRSRWSASCCRSSARWARARCPLLRERQRTSTAPTVRIRTNGPDFSLSFFSPYAGQAEKYEAEFRPGSRGLFTGKAKLFNGSWQLEQPHHLMFGDGDEAASLQQAAAGLPAHRQALRLGPHQGHRSRARPGHRGARRADPELRREHDVLDIMTALRWIHGPDDYAQVGRGAEAVPLRGGAGAQLVLARRRRAAQRALGAGPRGGEGTARGLRRAAAVRAHRGPARDRRPPRGGAGPRPPDEPPPPGRGRLRQDPRRPAGDAPGRRLRGQAVLLAPTEVLAQQHHRSITAMLGDLAAGRHARRRRARHLGRAAHRLDGQGPRRRRCSRWSPGRLAS